MPERLASRKLGFTEVFARMQVGAIGKLRRGDLLAPFQFDAEETQIGCVAATDYCCIALNQQRSRSSRFALLRMLFVQVIKRRLAPKVAASASKSGVDARPVRQAAHAVVDLLRGA